MKSPQEEHGLSETGMVKSLPPEFDSSPREGLRIAVVGKGGSGKTMVVATMTRVFASMGNLRVLAIDADSAVSLPYALGIEVDRTVSDIRNQMIENPQARREARDRHVSLLISDILKRGQGFDVLVMGRPEGPGCYCAINDLLKYGIETFSRQYDVTLIDCEAGPEQVNRRVVSGVGILMIITDPSMRGVRVAGSIWEVVRRDEQLKSTHVGLVINRLKAKADDGLIAESAARMGLEVFGRIPEDENIEQWDSAGRPIIDMPASSPSVEAIRDILRAVVPGRLGL